MNDLVSIVIPVYNSEKYLEDTLMSCLNQTYPNLEIITIIHDSEDKSLEILKKYSDKITILEMTNIDTWQPAVNLGIKRMKGEWFKFLSSDDVLYNNAIEELIYETKKIQDSKKIIFFSNFHRINSKSKIIGKRERPYQSPLSHFENNVKLLVEGIYGNINTGLIHKTAFDKYGFFDESLECSADHELFLRLCIKHGYRMHWVPKILFKIRFHDEELSVKKRDKMINEDNELRKIYLESMDTKNRKKFKAILKRRKRKALRDKILKPGGIIVKKFPKPISEKIIKFYRKWN